MTDYYCYSGGSNTSPYENWTKAATTLEVLDGTAGDNDVVHVASDHTESVAAAYTYTFSEGCWIITEDRVGGGYESMVAGGGSITCTSTSNDITIQKGIWKGLYFKSGDLLVLGSSLSYITFIDCKLELTNNDNYINVNGNSLRLTFIDCDIVTPNSAADNSGGVFAGSFDGSVVKMMGGLIDARYKTDLINNANSNKWIYVGVDLSNWSISAGSREILNVGSEGAVDVIGCIMPAAALTFAALDEGAELNIINSDDTGNDAYYMQRDNSLAQLITNTATYKTTGGYSPSESADILSWQIVDKDLNVAKMFETFAFGHWYNETLTSQTATVEILLADASVTAPTTDDIGFFIRHFDASADTTLLSGILTSPTIGDPLTTPTTWTLIGTDGTSGWTYGGSETQRKSYSLAQSFTAGRKGAIECVVWVRAIPATHELFINPVLTLS